ncbi:Na+/H+ antiporter subunit E [Mycolicibacterium insubricum]|uniref:Na+/H+ antiporter subunit E n=1 Tax=Mycolicibacterium insubricum TaxID=444597 RepID=A0A1X0DH76_9MYCO|nr:Na+/H+ antiporter subunit E [Mycolicibacterium insubricum]ORA71763.1 Na+/H+ antiporter subunit E [Mycolicibacterium insubricum]BBZ65618.1 Na+/H+ antiporter subunit E [Mycolicibacterium insubricum]
MNRWRRIVPRLALIGWLIAVWVLLWGHVSVPNLIGGLAVALVVTLALPLPEIPIEGYLRPLGLLRLIGYVAVSLVWSSLQMAWLAIRPQAPPMNAVLRAHLAIPSDLLLALAVNIINLTPGTIVLEIDQVRRLIYVHVLDVGSPRAIERFYRQIDQVQRRVLGAFPRYAPKAGERA